MSRNRCTREVWRALKKLELKLLRIFRALQTPHVHPFLNIRTLSINQFLLFTQICCRCVIKELVHAFRCEYIEKWMHLGSLESTQEVRVALGCASRNSFAYFVLSKLPAFNRFSKNARLIVIPLLITLDF